MPGPSLLTANCFAMLLRTGAGLASVVRGAVPVALFGTDGLGQRLSRLAVIRTLLGAAAPFAFALASAQIGLRPAPWLVVASGAAGLVVMALLWRDIGRLQAAPAAA